MEFANVYYIRRLSSTFDRQCISPGRNDLPVLLLFLGRKKSASMAGTPIAIKVNNDMRSIHVATGPGSRPPVVVDDKDGKVPFQPAKLYKYHVVKRSYTIYFKAIVSLAG